MVAARLRNCQERFLPGERDIGSRTPDVEARQHRVARRVDVVHDEILGGGVVRRERHAQNALFGAGRDPRRDVEERCGLEDAVLDDADRPGPLHHEQAAAIPGRRGDVERVAHPGRHGVQLEHGIARLCRKVRDGERERLGDLSDSVAGSVHHERVHGRRHSGAHDDGDGGRGDRAGGLHVGDGGGDARRRAGDREVYGTAEASGPGERGGHRLRSTLLDGRAGL